MKTFLLILIALVFLVTGCDSSSEHQAPSEAIAQELQAQREELNQLRSELDAERRRIQRSITVIQSHVDDLNRSLKLASAEIWGDGSSTGSLLSTALRTLTSVQAEIDALGNALRAGSDMPRQYRE